MGVEEHKKQIIISTILELLQRASICQLEDIMVFIKNYIA